MVAENCGRSRRGYYGRVNGKIVTDIDDICYLYNNFCFIFLTRRVLTFICLWNRIFDLKSNLEER